MTFYLVRHVASGQFMPQMKRGRGYSHWNPAGNDVLHGKEPIPRLLTSEKQARRVIAAWVLYPNASVKFFDGLCGTEEDFNVKDDGRKVEDLAIVKVELVEVV